MPANRKHTITNKHYSILNIPGGRIVNCQSSIVNYEYNLTDHLGNVRVTFSEKNGEAIIIQEDHYYPFGMRMSGQHFSNTELLNKFLYNGKEQQEQTLYYDYGFRQMDAQLGRWHVIDAMAEKYMSTSPYAYVMNNPISHIDVAGLYVDESLRGLMHPQHWGRDSYAGPIDNGINGLMGLGTAHHNNPGRNIGGSFENYWSQENGEWVYTGYHETGNGHYETRTGRKLTSKGYGLNSDRGKNSGGTLIGRILRNLKWKSFEYDVWVEDVDGSVGVPFGGTMFYTESGKFLYATHYDYTYDANASGNQIITIKDEGMSIYNDIMKKHKGDDRSLAYYIKSKRTHNNIVAGIYSVIEPTSINDTEVLVFRDRSEIPWYIYVAAIGYHMAEGFSAGYMGVKSRNEGLKHHYKMLLDTESPWSNYFGIHKFETWW